MQSYEVEIKSLLGSSERADEVRAAMKKLDPSSTLQSKNKQLNHYYTFEPALNMEFGSGTLKKLAQVVGRKLSDDVRNKLQDLAKSATDFSVRTRDKDSTVFIVVKASIGSDSSANGVARIEFEEKFPATIQELDSLVLSAGFSYQAKWSRQREEYVCKGVNVTLDKNAGYGWLAEFERIVDDAGKVDGAEAEVRTLMKKLKVQELPQDRLERMFAHYNANWREYYGTEKIFVVE